MQDTFQWNETKSGIYTTKSGYVSAVDQDADWRLLTKVPPTFNWFNSVWNIKAPPKIKTFLWKAIQEALPTGANCSSRGLDVPSTCKRCGMIETTAHILFNCRFALQVWDSSVWKNRPPDFSVTSTRHISELINLTHRFTSLPPFGINSSAVQAWILWNLWKDRNNLCFSNTSLTPKEIITKSFREAREWQDAQESKTQKQNNNLLPIQRVSKQATYPFICYVDAAWKEDYKAAGLGMIFQGTEALQNRTFSKSQEWISSSTQAEGLAILEAVKTAAQLQLPSITIFSDSRECIGAINSGNHRELIGIIKDIVHFSNQIEQVSFISIPRSANCIADSVAKSALDDLIVDRQLNPV